MGFGFGGDFGFSCLFSFVCLGGNLILVVFGCLFGVYAF